MAIGPSVCKDSTNAAVVRRQLEDLEGVPKQGPAVAGGSLSFPVSIFGYKAPRRSGDGPAHSREVLPIPAAAEVTLRVPPAWVEPVDDFAQGDGALPPRVILRGHDLPPTLPRVLIGIPVASTSASHGGRNRRTH